MLRMTEPAGRRSGSLRSYLRAATQEQHRQLDRIAGGFDYGSRQGYARLLAAHAGALIPLEHALEEAGVRRVLPDWPARSRTTALKHDLAILKLKPLIFPVAVASSEAEIFGTLYVLEGSRLGARVILRGIDQTINDIGATNYLHHGEDKNFWGSFLAALESSPAAAEQPEAVQRAAASTFAAFGRAFECGQWVDA